MARFLMQPSSKLSSRLDFPLLHVRMLDTTLPIYQLPVCETSLHAKQACCSKNYLQEERGFLDRLFCTCLPRSCMKIPTCSDPAVLPCAARTIMTWPSTPSCSSPSFVSRRRHEQLRLSPVTSHGIPPVPACTLQIDLSLFLFSFCLIHGKSTWLADH